MGDLKGKVAIVTGSSRGIGKAIAEELGRRGASVVINYSQEKSADAAKQVADGIQKNGGKAIVVKADMSKLADIKHLFSETVKALGGLDILVNNAGTYSANAFVAYSEEEYDRLFALNTKGPFFAMQEAVKIIRDNGRIINIGSGLTKTYNLGYMSLYGATKAALEQFTRALAWELGSKQVTVNTVSPGPTATDQLPESYHKQASEATPFKRVGAVGDIADVVAFLASEKARWVTGQNLQISGGVNNGP